MKKFKYIGIEWLALFTALCWGSGSFFGKRAMAIGHLSPIVGITLRTFMALIFFLLLLASFGKKLHINIRKELSFAWKLSKKGLFQIIFFEGFLAGGLGMFLYYLAISRGELSLVMPLAFLSPFWGTLLALLFKDEQFTYQRSLGLTLTFVGIVIISVKLLSLEEIFQWRIEYVALLTGICWGIGSFFGKRGMKKASITPFVGITLRSATSLLVLLVSVFTLGSILFNANFFLELTWIVRNEFVQFLLILLFEGGIAGFLGMLFYYISLRKGDLSLVMPLAFTSPLWGTLLSLLWGTEVFTLQRIVGMFFILVGISFTVAPNLNKPVFTNNSHERIDLIIKRH